MKLKNICILVVLAITLSACNINYTFNGINGEGPVTSLERDVTNFHSIKGATGLLVKLQEGDEEKVVVQADENLHEFIETYVKDGVLTIKSSKNLGYYKKADITVTYKALKSINASSGAMIVAVNEIKAENLKLNSSSGADISLKVFSKNLKLNSSSGADLVVSGKTIELIADASSGADIQAKDLESINCIAEASSGGLVRVNVKEKINTRASSGGDIDYYGDPVVTSNSDPFSGSVNKM